MSGISINDSLLAGITSSPFDYDGNETGVSYMSQDETDCLYQETQLERTLYEEEGYYELEMFTHYLSGFGGLSVAIVGLVLNLFCAFTLCRAAIFRAHLVFLCAVATASALQLSCLIVILTREIRLPDPRYLNLLPRLYIRVFLYMYPLSKFFHLAMAWLVMASTVDCWRLVRKAQKKEDWLKARSVKRIKSLSKSNSTNSEFNQTEAELVQGESKTNCRVLVTELLVVAAIVLMALVYTIPTAWENKGDILLLGKIGTDTNCTAFIYHLMQTELSQTALYRVCYSLLGHLIFQTGIPLVASSIAIAKISHQLQVTSTSLGQLVTDAVQLVMRTVDRDVSRQQMPIPTYTQRIILENRNIIHCSLFLSVFTFYVCHVPQLWAKIQWSLMHSETHQNSHMKYVNEFVNFITVANATVNGLFILCFCRYFVAEGARDTDMCSWCFPQKGSKSLLSKTLCGKGKSDPPSTNSDQGDDEAEQEEPENETNEQNVDQMAGEAQMIEESYQPPLSTMQPYDDQYLLDADEVYKKPHQHRHHHRHSHRHSSRRQCYDQQQQMTLGEMPAVFSTPQQSFPATQQYFTMGPHDSDIYVAAQV